MTNIEVLMQDGCTKAEAENHLKRGTVVYEESDKDYFIEESVSQGFTEYELDDLREQCVEEGNDPEGDIFDSMADELYKRYMEAEKKCEDYSDYY